MDPPMIDKSVQVDFICHNCAGSLMRQRYVMKEDHVMCIPCYEKLFTNTCDKCQQPIGINSKDLSYKDRHWHEKCFICVVCLGSLMDKPFGSKGNEIYCALCYDDKFAIRCDGCGNPFHGGDKKLEYVGRHWHEECFACKSCGLVIGSGSFIPKGEDAYCSPCFEKQFSTKCHQCHKAITGEGVSFHGEPWHKQCFVCASCKNSLASQRFTVREDRPYCSSCFAELFAKRCVACLKPIIGPSGSKYVILKDDHWHSECFVCASCKEQLSGKGFVTDGSDLLCSLCAKNRVQASIPQTH